MGLRTDADGRIKRAIRLLINPDGAGCMVASRFCLLPENTKMPCETARLPNQTIAERKIEVREAMANLSKDLAAGKVKVVIGPTGAVAFTGWTQRNRVTDNCAYRMIAAAGSPMAKAAIARAELLSGKSVNRQAVAHGHHAHAGSDGALHWHTHKG